MENQFLDSVLHPMPSNFEMIHPLKGTKIGQHGTKKLSAETIKVIMGKTNPV